MQLPQPFNLKMRGWQIRKTNDGGFAMCGQINNAPLLYKSIGFVKFDSLGNTQYTSIFSPDNNMQPVFIYPTPADEFIQFALPGEFKNSASTLFVFDLNGQKIMSVILDNQQPVNINHLPNGIYIAEVHNAKGDVVRQKLVMQH